MSIKNTAQNKVKWALKFPPEEENLNDRSFLELSKRMVDSPTLRRFFIGEIFSDLFDIDTALCEFVRSMKLFPEVYYKSSGHDFLDFFERMRGNAARVFKKNLHTTFEDVCSNACEMGIFKPQSYFADYNGKFILIHAENDIKEAKDVYATFYKVAEAFHEPWIKPENRGKMLELWTYILVKGYLKKRGYKVYKNVEVVEDRELSLDDITDARNQMHTSIGEIDCLVCQKGQLKGIIECKMDKDFGWAGARAFYGSMQLLKVQFGAIIVGHKETFKTDHILEEQNMAIFPNILDRNDFPKVLFDYLDTKLPN